MVASSGPASPSPSDTARTAALAGALDRLKQRPVPTEGQSAALAHLDAIRKDLKDGPKRAAAAKVAYLRNKLMAIKLAAAAASATGDPKLVRSATQEMRALIKELARALKDAGIAQGAAAPSDAVSEDAAKPAAAGDAPAPDELGEAREAAKDLVKELKKVVAKLRLALVAARTRGADPEAVKEAEKNLQDGEKELQSLGSSLGLNSSSGGAVDLRA